MNSDAVTNQYIVMLNNTRAQLEYRVLQLETEVADLKKQLEEKKNV